MHEERGVTHQATLGVCEEMIFAGAASEVCIDGCRNICDDVLEGNKLDDNPFLESIVTEAIAHIQKKMKTNGHDESIVRDTVMFMCQRTNDHRGSTSEHNHDSVKNTVGNEDATVGKDKYFRYISPTDANKVLLLSLKNPMIITFKKEAFTTTFKMFHIFYSHHVH